jgi:hypothetical protein
MNKNLLVLAFALSSAAWGAQITLQPGPNGTYVDLVIDGLGNSQVGAFNLLIDSPFMIGAVRASGLGLLGVTGVETFFDSQTMVIGPIMRRMEVIEVSLLPTADLIALQSPRAGTFGLVRILPTSRWPELVFLSLSGTISDAAGDPIPTTFVSGELRKLPEPGTLSLVLVASILVLLRIALRSGSRPGQPPIRS